MLLRRAVVSLGVFIVSTAACGGVVQEETNGGAGGTTSSSSGGPCDGYKDAKPRPPAEILFRNDGLQPVYLAANCDAVNYKITRLGEQAGSTFFPGQRSCLQTCEDLRTESPFDCAPCVPTSYVIPAGGTLSVPWDGLGVEGRSMARECWEEPKFATACLQLVTAPAGTYRIEATGYMSCPNCTCDPTGRCVGAAEGMQAVPNINTVEVPWANPAEVVFGVCAFGCGG